MKCKGTPLTAQIFSNIQAHSSHAACLIVQDEDPCLSFGFNQTGDITYFIHLQTDGKDILLTTGDQQEFALLMDTDEKNSPRLVLFLAGTEEAVLEYSRDDGVPIRGTILILAQEENGSRRAIVHAVFTVNNQASLVIDSSPILYEHLRICTALAESEMIE